VDLLTGDIRRAMSRTAGGWWVCTVAEACPGTDYAFSLDGGPPRPNEQLVASNGLVHDETLAVLNGPGPT